jgi:hypothetical protein
MKTNKIRKTVTEQLRTGSNIERRIQTPANADVNEGRELKASSANEEAKKVLFPGNSRADRDIKTRRLNKLVVRRLCKQASTEMITELQRERHVPLMYS